MKPETVRRSAPVLVAVLVLALLGVVYVGVRVVGSTRSSDRAGSGGYDVPVLRLTAYYAPDPQAAPDPRYGLSSPLSTQVPPAMELRTVSPYGDLDARAARLATAVGLSASPTREGRSTVWSDDTRRLIVEPSGLWTLASTMAYAGSGTVTGGGSAGATPAATTATDDEVTSNRRAARTLLDAVGVAPDAAQETVQGGSVILTAAPDLGGLPSVGLGTTVSATGGAVAYAQGWLAATDRGATYPVVSAADAFDALTRTPLPMPLMACPVEQSPAPDSLVCGGPVTVIAARLGLTLQQTVDAPLMVPSWLFDVKDSERPLAQIAVPARFLASAPSPDGSAGGGVGVGVGGGVGPGQPLSPGQSLSPGQPSDSPGTGPSDMPVDPPQSIFTSVTRGADDRAIDVTFWGGVPDCYSYRVAVKQQAGSPVRLSLVTTAQPDKACIDLAVQVTKTVTLSAPLGIRRVVDAATGLTLLGPTR